MDLLYNILYFKRFNHRKVGWVISNKQKILFIINKIANLFGQYIYIIYFCSKQQISERKNTAKRKHDCLISLAKFYI